MKTEAKTEPKTVQLNIDVPEDVRRDLKVVAAMRGQPLKAVLTVALVEFSKQSLKKGDKEALMALWGSHVRIVSAPPVSAGSKGTSNGHDVLPGLPGSTGIQASAGRYLRRKQLCPK